MRVGVVQSWLGSRYLSFWKAYLQALGVEVVYPKTGPKLPLPPPIQQVVSEVLSLKNEPVDYLLLPDVQLGVEAQRGTPPLWLVDLAASLDQLISGLPPALVVPAELSPEVVGLAAQIGQSLVKNPMLVRRALERTKGYLAPSYKAPLQAGTHLVGLIAQPMLTQEGEWLQTLRTGLEAQGLSLFLADRPPAELRQEGAHLGLGLELPTDLEAAGMHRYLLRLGKVQALLYVHDPEYLPLPAPLRRALRKTPPSKPWRMVGLEADWSRVGLELSRGRAG
ncbi:hypothetical protein DV704_00205 [Meiothermus sp. QL-1]|uniref:hypothetical protein n=1 Tax=Meiothermus sp. QL-1 TaxID=2058095 RepID=UPI000E0C211E|nr:hypothetical protein [Meiothermus sp. QL-1]RDI96290.1 hypothetical protein DV704_00205 [Meiothermus sp. QL-1]